MEGQVPALGCKLAPKVPPGTILTDMRGRQWIVGKSIGAGGFGAIYLARRRGESEETLEYVCKIEPHSNGPLFVEMHAFFRICEENALSQWKPNNKQKPQGWVGIPNFFGAGSGKIKGESIRFLVMSRLGSDIEKFFQSGERPLPRTTALNIAIQIIDSLEYIHSRNYCHNDIKAQNILLGPDQGHCDVYLADFGLACKYKDNYGYHCDELPDDRKAHEGTLIYTSRDAHLGAHSRRGDLETLGYNLVHWLSGHLPWKLSEDAEFVQAQKIAFMDHIESFLTKSFKPDPYPPFLQDFLNYVGSLEFSASPDYNKLRKILIKEIQANGKEPYSKLIFSTKKPKRKVIQEEEEEEEEDEEEEIVRHTRSQDDEARTSAWSWESVLWSNPEAIIRQASRSNEDTESANPERDAAFLERQRGTLLNPTPEMSRILAARAALEAARQQLSWKEQLSEYNNRQAAIKAKFASMDLTPSTMTPAMEEVVANRAKRMASGVSSPITPDTSDTEEEEEEEEAAEDVTDSHHVTPAKVKRALLQQHGKTTSHSGKTTSHSGAGQQRRGSVTPKKSGSVTPCKSSSRSRAVTPIDSAYNSRIVTPDPQERRVVTRSGAGSRAASRASSPGGDHHPTDVNGGPPVRATRAAARANSGSRATRAAGRATSGSRATRASARANSESELVDRNRVGIRKRRLRSADGNVDKTRHVKFETLRNPPSPSSSTSLKVTCDVCKKRITSKYLEKHLNSFHPTTIVEEEEEVDGEDELAKDSRMEVEGNFSPETPVAQRWTAPKLTRHNTPALNQEQEILPCRVKLSCRVSLPACQGTPLGGTPRQHHHRATARGTARLATRPSLTAAGTGGGNETAATPELAAGSGLTTTTPCPLCGLVLPKLRIPDHFDSVHSPASRKLRNIKVPTFGLAVTVSSDSPKKIRNLDSPGKSANEEEEGEEEEEGGSGKPSTPCHVPISERVKIKRGLILF